MLEVFLSLIDSEEEKRKFEKLYYKYRDLIYWIAFEYLNNHETAEDCVQDVFTYIATHFDNIDDIDSKRTRKYLAIITKGKAISLYRKESIREYIDIEEIDESVFDNYDKIELSEAIEHLSDEQKTIIMLKYVYDMTSSEIGSCLSMSDALVRKKLQFAMGKLRKILSEETEIHEQTERSL